MCALPAALTLFLGFQAGGYFPGAPAIAAVVLVAILVGRVLVLPRPFAGASVPFAIAAGALALYAAWTLGSAAWSHAPGRALIEFDRVLVYVLALVLGGSMARTLRRLRWMAGGVAIAFVALALAALLSRVLPDVFPVAGDPLGSERLSYPLTYWNALGLLAALGIVLCLWATSERAGRVGPVLAAAALPILGATLLLTYSRGAIGVAIAGVMAYVLIGRPRALAGALLAGVPTAAGALLATYHANLLSGPNPTSPAAVAQGHRLALVLLACVAGAALLRLVALPVDRRLARLRLPARPRPAVALGAGVAVVAVWWRSPWRPAPQPRRAAPTTGSPATRSGARRPRAASRS